ncbi:MAG: peptide-methionine (S)-S-oxide reductase MsrA [Nevskia sp.]
MRAFLAGCCLAFLSLTASAATTPAPGGSPLPVANEVATFAGGCFWCMEPPFKKLAGVIAVTSGYTGGTRPNPSYHEVSSGETGHAESVEVVYDPTKIGYDKLLDVFWHNIDPTVSKQQFCDRGDQYRTAIFYHGARQKKLAEASRATLRKSGVLHGATIATEITPASAFYAAEEFHQDYSRKEAVRYEIYRHACGRDQRLQQLYGDKVGGGAH